MNSDSPIYARSNYAEGVDFLRVEAYLKSKEFFFAQRLIDNTNTSLTEEQRQYLKLKANVLSRSYIFKLVVLDSDIFSEKSSLRSIEQMVAFQRRFYSKEDGFRLLKNVVFWGLESCNLIGEYADYLYHHNEFIRALFFYKKALSLDQFNTLILNKLSRCYWKMGDQKKAMELLQRVLQIQPGNKTALRNLGILTGKAR